MALDFRGAVKNLKTDIANSGLGRFFSGLKNLFQTIASPENGTSLLNSWTGAHLTGAQQEANQFNAEQAEIQRNWEMNMSNTAYQRQVNDLQAAGINPIMAASSGVSLPTSAAAASVSPSAATFQLSQLLELYRLKEMLPLEKAAISAQIGKTKAETGKIGSEKVGIDILNNYRASSEELRLEGLNLANELSKANREAVYKSIDKMSTDIKLIERQADTELKKAAAVSASALLSEAQASQIVELLPFEKALKSAQTAEARQAAALAAANAAYQNRLIDLGYIEAQVRTAYKESALAGVKLDNAQLQYEINQIRGAFRTGKLPDSMDSKVNQIVLDYVLQPLELLLDNFNPLSNMLGKAESIK